MTFKYNPCYPIEKIIKNDAESSIDPIIRSKQILERLISPKQKMNKKYLNTRKIKEIVLINPNKINNINTLLDRSNTLNQEEINKNNNISKSKSNSKERKYRNSKTIQISNSKIQLNKKKYHCPNNSISIYKRDGNKLSIDKMMELINDNNNHTNTKINTVNNTNICSNIAKTRLNNIQALNTINKEKIIKLNKPNNLVPIKTEGDTKLPNIQTIKTRNVDINNKQINSFNSKSITTNNYKTKSIDSNNIYSSIINDFYDETFNEQISTNVITNNLFNIKSFYIFGIIQGLGHNRKIIVNIARDCFIRYFEDYRNYNNISINMDINNNKIQNTNNNNLYISSNHYPNKDNLENIICYNNFEFIYNAFMKVDFELKEKAYFMGEELYNNINDSNKDADEEDEHEEDDDEIDDINETNNLYNYSANFIIVIKNKIIYINKGNKVITCGINKLIKDNTDFINSKNFKNFKNENIKIERSNINKCNIINHDINYKGNTFLNYDIDIKRIEYNEEMRYIFMCSELCYKFANWANVIKIIYKDCKKMYAQIISNNNIKQKKSDMSITNDITNNNNFNNNNTDNINKTNGNKIKLIPILVKKGNEIYEYSNKMYKDYYKNNKNINFSLIIISLKPIITNKL